MLLLDDVTEITWLTTADKLRSLADAIEKKAPEACVGESTLVDSIYGTKAILKIGYDQQKERTSTNYKPEEA